MGERLRAGDVPYRGLFDHKPPGVYLYAALFQMAPWVTTWPATWIGSVVALWGAGLAAWRITAAGLTSRGAQPAPGATWPSVSAGLLLVAFLGAPGLALGGGMTELVGALPALCAVWAAAAARRQLPHAARWSLLAGGAASMTGASLCCARCQIGELCRAARQCRGDPGVARQPCRVAASATGAESSDVYDSGRWSLPACCTPLPPD